MEQAANAIIAYEQNYAETIMGDWTYWTMLITTIERQICSLIIELSGKCPPCEQKLSNARRLLFELDQRLYQIGKFCSFPGIDQNEITGFLKYFIGQLVLHVTSVFLFQEIAQTEWKVIVKETLPLLLFAYNFGPVDTFQIDSSFRVSQMANFLISCVSDDANKLRKLWSSEKDVLNDAQSIFNDSEWRKNIFMRIFISEDHRAAGETSFLMNSKILEGTHFLNWPSMIDVLVYDLKSQEANPGKLAHLVYLVLCYENQINLISTATVNSDFKLVIFKRLHFSTVDLKNCNAQTISQLDVEAFLHATVIQAKQTIDVKTNGLMLPYSNLALHLCTAEQSAWWEMVFNVRN